MIDRSELSEDMVKLIDTGYIKNYKVPEFAIIFCGNDVGIKTNEVEATSDSDEMPAGSKLSSLYDKVYDVYRFRALNRFIDEEKNRKEKFNKFTAILDSIVSDPDNPMPYFPEGSLRHQSYEGGKINKILSFKLLNKNVLDLILDKYDRLEDKTDRRPLFDYCLELEKEGKAEKILNPLRDYSNVDFYKEIFSY